MNNHQIHFGRKFYREKRSGYWLSTDYGKNKPRIRAHQWIWINTHGPIPKGYEIHHKNNDKSDNRIENLELIERSRHKSHHLNQPERKAKSREICDKIRPLTKEWHGSKEGKAWHKLHAIKSKFGNWEALDYNCEHCNKPFKSSKLSNTKFCSNNCKSAWRRKSGLDDIEIVCQGCKKNFKINKYSKTKCCSKKCGGEFRRNRNREYF